MGCVGAVCGFRAEDLDPSSLQVGVPIAVLGSPSANWFGKKRWFMSGLRCSGTMLSDDGRRSLITEYKHAMRDRLSKSWLLWSAIVVAIVFGFVRRIRTPLLVSPWKNGQIVPLEHSRDRWRCATLCNLKLSSATRTKAAFCASAANSHLVPQLRRSCKVQRTSGAGGSRH